MLEIAVVIARGPRRFKADRLQAELALAQSTVFRTIRVLEGLSLVVRQERKARTEGLEYRRQNHTFWEAAMDLAEIEEKP